ncbi:hypothetical protein DPMN_060441 [Dreissena polymorpha]|uniref:Uncharacterized protein n=1 Tax=Dreissena polymorpha TaxID=45954 RepID=A0A9D4C5U0_DREPO|nr:hypothetical protein DPMN_060441 [Dreissena polymorpha]
MRSVWRPAARLLTSWSVNSISCVSQERRSRKKVMLEFIQNVVGVEVLGKVRINYMFYGFTEDTGQRDRTIVCRVTGVLFFL